MAVRKRCLLWDWTNTRDMPDTIEQLNFSGPFSSVANWNPWVPPELKGRLPYRPTIRTPAQLEGNDWAMIADYERNRHEVVHYFNEPERIPGCTPELAADKWATQVVPLLRATQGRKLVGPAVASDDAGRAWLRRFMALVAGCVPDYLGVHYYGTVAAEARAYITSMHEEWPSLPVVVSEVASISRSGPEVEKFTAELANWLDETEWVYEYAFFGCMNHCADDFVSPAAQLMDKDGKFTPLMKRLMDEQPMKV
ncbi:putative glycosyl hydrolase 53 domain-containing protein [Phaeoacremonium minimum UCRPA7]|uniref:Putative glycosyl hydrolase 53 domain-containing protein n=1 Tax=Phaeoacremonium minimum (strain UCR-PA7) TaxID=1286976 RepID=R8BWZ4_PHAM7|nr:putative glycosyl hydrolase 53 domain-containing protein [Phaeoacremonium minimum UCRPA7]EOO03852.1 putative glycosyl hydrolase 53 domain-containing protein [Phaeoacremonium minimum UCRPA7]